MAFSLPLVNCFDESNRVQKSSSGRGAGDGDLFREDDSFKGAEVAGVWLVGVVFLGVGSKLSHISSSQPEDWAVLTSLACNNLL